MSDSKNTIGHRLDFGFEISVVFKSGKIRDTIQASQIEARRHYIIYFEEICIPVYLNLYLVYCTV